VTSKSQSRKSNLKLPITKALKNTNIKNNKTENNNNIFSSVENKAEYVIHNSEPDQLYYNSVQLGTSSNNSGSGNINVIIY
jgi:hypothetical protein